MRAAGIGGGRARALRAAWRAHCRLGHGDDLNVCSVCPRDARHEREPAAVAGGRGPVVLVVLVCAAAYLANLSALQIGQHIDDAVYVSVGRSLAAGLGYVRYEDPRHPVEPQYPPALPLLIALVLRLGGDLEALRIIPLVFSLASLLLADAYFRSRLPSAGAHPDGPWRQLLLALFGLNHLVVGYAGMIMTEAPFICMTLAALVLLGPAPATDAPRRRRRGGVVAVALVLAVACLFRAAGLALVVGAAAWLFVRGRRSDAALLVAVTAALLAPWLIFQRAVTGRWLGAGYGVDVVSAGQLQPGRSPCARWITCWHLDAPVPGGAASLFGERVEALLARWHWGGWRRRWGWWSRSWWWRAR